MEINFNGKQNQSVWYNVTFCPKNYKRLNIIFEHEDKLRNKGITFDVTTCSSDFSREWQLNHNLKGAKVQTILNYVKRHIKMYYEITKPGSRLFIKRMNGGNNEETISHN